MAGPTEGVWRTRRLITFYLEHVLNQKILARPSKGPYGEAGKDIVAVEDMATGEYCSYVVKAGDLSKTLDGKYGVLKQMDDAMRIPLDDPAYNGKRRTLVVVHNGVEGNRGAIKKFEDAKARLESEFATVLRSPIQRWDGSALAKILFPHGGPFKQFDEYQNEIGRLNSAVDVVVKIKEKLPAVQQGIMQPKSPSEILAAEISESIAKAERKYGQFKVA